MVFDHPTRGRVEPHDGVHTTGQFNIAASYAMGTWRQESFVGYPVVLSINVTGLEPFHDVDAELILREHLSYIRSDIKKSLEEGEDLNSIADWLSEREYEAVETPEQVVFQYAQEDPNVVSTIMSLYGDKEATELVARFADTGELPPDVLMDLVDQRRYLDDIEEDRVYSVVAFRPWFAYLVDDMEEGVIEEAESAGWHVVTQDDAWSSCGDFNPGEQEVLYQRRGRPPEDLQYHGTVSTLAAAAFPDLDLPDPEANIWGIDVDE
jgi:hypothetical protein